MIERPRPQSKVSLEDLLRLKRAERPAPEFWAEFEDQLRRKQLAAIVDRRPWWRRLSTASLAKISIPVGVTAVIAFTLVTVRERAQPVPDVTLATATAVAPSSASSLTAHKMESSAADAGGSLIASADLVNAPVSQTSFSSTSLVNAPVSSGSSVEGGSTPVATHDLPEPSLAQVILGLEGTTESDARPQFHSDSTPLLASMDILGRSGRAQEISSMDGISLSQISAPRDSRRARLLASVDSQEHGDLVSGNSRVARSRERIASRLAEQSLYDSISRLGLNGDSVSIKF